MPSLNHPEFIAQNRTVRASSLVDGRVDLSTYPHRYIAVVAQAAFHGNQMKVALTAIEQLEDSGWELASLSESHIGVITAVMRRN